MPRPPAGSSASPSGSVGLTVVTTSTTPLGTYKLTIVGTSGTKKHSVTALLYVTRPDSGFALSASPSTATVSPGSGAAYTVTVSRTVKTASWQAGEAVGAMVTASGTGAARSMP